MTVNSDQFKAGLQLWASGVTVVTTQEPSAEPKGMTATSFASVSMEPPQILVCLNEVTDTVQAIQNSQSFVVNILSQAQDSVSNQFAGGASQAERFANVDWQSGTYGQPVLSKCLAALECRVAQMVKAGSHWVVVGEVQAISLLEQGQPLLYYRSGYRTLSD